MTTHPATLTRFRRDAQRLGKRITRKLTQKAEISLAVTLSLPPFLKVVVTYKRAANDDRPADRSAA